MDLRNPLPALVAAALDLGEAAVIQLALETAARWVAIDDWKGRRAALATGLRVTGSLGLLGRAKQVGLLPAVRPVIEAAIAQGIRYHPNLVREVLRAVGESGP
jgi:predicted nucleic acid-binding protein